MTNLSNFYHLIVAYSLGENVRFRLRQNNIEPGSPWENGYIERFNGKFRYELLNCEIFDTLFEAKVLIEKWRREYNTFRPHSSLGYLPPVPETVEVKQTVSATLQLSV